MLLVDEARARLAARGVTPPDAGVIFDEVWDLAKALARQERRLELAADWHASLSGEAHAAIEEGLSAAVGRWAVPALADERRLVELDPMSWRMTLECLPPSPVELAGYDRVCSGNGGREP